MRELGIVDMLLAALREAETVKALRACGRSHELFGFPMPCLPAFDAAQEDGGLVETSRDESVGQMGVSALSSTRRSERPCIRTRRIAHRGLLALEKCKWLDPLAFVSHLLSTRTTAGPPSHSANCA